MTAPSGSASTSKPPKVPPRWFITTFWKGHRVLHRLSGGRWSLARPIKRRRWGMMRLRTVGRRSGVERAAILAYYEDDANLVALAMNGWADPEPAWWLNLQAKPDAEVDLVGGSRRVHAREATGEERDRLWARFADYSGPNDDLDALATLRDRQTAVVVFEPR